MSISVSQAKRLVLEVAKPLEAESIALDEKALGRVLAEPLSAAQDSPRWTVSAMDGFAVRSADFPRAYETGLEISGLALAGSALRRLSQGEAIRIMTGALIPKGADAVLPKELVLEADGKIFADATANLGPGDHVRFAGEEFKRGSKVAVAGSRLNSRWIGFLNGLGISRALVLGKPRVNLLVSGNELKRAGTSLKPGQIYDSNLPMLKAALAEEGLACNSRRLKDNPDAVASTLKAALSSSDLVLLSGGISVGDADYSKGALKACGVETLFWGVAQKPGKPLYFGRKGTCLVFGLPGNPAAAWVCFHEYVRPALCALQGKDLSETSRAKSLKEPKRDQSKTLFLKARLKGSEVELLGGQQSHMLRSLAESNALVVVEPKGSGRLLEVHPL